MSKLGRKTYQISEKDQIERITERMYKNELNIKNLIEFLEDYLNETEHFCKVKILKALFKSYY